jgi:TolB protein
VWSDETNDWFPHISSDGKWMVFLSYDKTVTGHPWGEDVVLNLMSMQDKKVYLLAKLFGGQARSTSHRVSRQFEAGVRQL